MSKYNWEDIKNRYITTNVTLPELSRQINIPEITLAYHSSREKWLKLRKSHNSIIYNKIISKDIKDKSNLAIDERQERIRLLKKFIKRELKALSEGEYPVKSREGISRAIVDNVKTLELLEGRPSERTELLGELKGKSTRQIHALILQSLVQPTPGSGRVNP